MSIRKKVKVLCACGKVYVARLDNIKSGHTKSCGCLHSQTAKHNATKHGHTTGGTRTREYNSRVNVIGDYYLNMVNIIHNN